MDTLDAEIFLCLERTRERFFAHLDRRNDRFTLVLESFLSSVYETSLSNSQSRESWERSELTGAIDEFSSPAENIVSHACTKNCRLCYTQKKC